MTTIAWDGRTLAADRRCTVSGFVFQVSKLRRTSDGRLLGIAGDLRSGKVWLDWLEKPAALRSAPPPPEKEPAMVLEVFPDGRVFRSCNGTSVEVSAPGFHAIGSGRDFAVAAMALGRNALQAVELAARFDCYSGDGVDTLELEREQAPPACASDCAACPAGCAA